MAAVAWPAQPRPVLPTLSPAVLLLAGVLLATGACQSRDDHSETVAPLFDGSRTPLVLTESLAIEPPASLDANRFVRGWWPLSGNRLAATEGARIQGVKLADARRLLVLETELLKGNASPSVDVRVGGRNWRTLPVKPRMKIGIPATLPLGRFRIDLRAPEDTAIAVRSAFFKKAAPRGQVAFEEEGLVQSGFSLVETVRRMTGGAVLRGRFRPPHTPEAQQVFSLIVTGDDGRQREVFSWKALEGEGASAAAQSFEVALDPGWNTIRFLALGTGPPARWDDLTLRRAAPRASPEESPPDSTPTPPRIVILYVMDALRADHVGHLGERDDISPTIDRLAAEGASFERHFSVAPNTVPAMKTMFSGNVYLLDGKNKLARGATTLAQRFGEAGYRTALFSGNGNVSSWRGLARGFEHVASGVMFGSTGRRTAGYNNNAEVLHGAALSWLSELEQDDKAFLHIQTIHPHNPYDPPEPFASRFVPDNGSSIDGKTRTLKAIRDGQLEVSRADEERLRGLYAASVAYNDSQLEAFLETVLAHHAPEDVLLIVTSDHGEELFEHGGVLHGYTLYEELLHIPLVMWWPGTIEPRFLSGLTDTLDLHKTLGLAASGAAQMKTSGGRSLWPTLLAEPGHELGQDPQNDKNVLFAAASSLEGGIFMARSEDFKVIWAPRTPRRWGQGASRGRDRDAEYAFDLATDPTESINLSGESRPEIDWLRSQLLAWIEAGKMLEAGAPVEDLDDATRESLRALGYLD